MKLVGAVTRLRQVTWAFFRLGFQQAIAYPLAFVMGYATAVLPVFIFFFVARLVDRPGPSAGGDYFTFVVIGLVGVRVLDTGIRAFSREMEVAINRGWLEMFLVEPVRWRLLPFAMAQWTVVEGVIGAVLIASLGVMLGADLLWAGIPAAALILTLGLAAGLAVGTLAASLKVLAKSGDPILTVYSLGAQIFSGVYFSLEVLPAGLRPISWLIPHTYVIQALRRVLMPAGSALPGLSSLEAVGMMVAFCVVGYPVSLWLYGRALEYGRKLGVLSGY
jgi:ABC-2 type transport system permease protein